MGNAVKKYGIMYFEEPTAPFADYLSYVHRETGIKVASGERMYGRNQYKERLDKEAIQVIQPDLGQCGGITEVKKICDMAAAYEASIQIHTCGSPLVTAASLHMEAAIPGFIIHEYNVNTNGPKMVSLAKYNYQPENGFYKVPELPGIGNEISEYAFKHSEIVTIEAAEEKNW
jgi:L-alanine-DL-glutamate epimerase-like enolase superfamily enzyme